jgi:predicted aspartyl protease
MFNDILVDTNKKSRITTASGVEYVAEITAEKIKIGNIELSDIRIHGHTFPQESFATGVVGMNVLKLFDLWLLFSKNEIIFKDI